MAPFAPPLSARASSCQFEVATIKPAVGPSVVRPFATGGGRVVAQGIRLKGLIYYAYGSGLSTALNVSGGPDWINKNRYDVQAQGRGRIRLTARFARCSGRWSKSAWGEAAS